MQLLHSVAVCSDSHSLMNSESLALVVSPNLMPVGSSRKETMCSDVKTTSGGLILHGQYIHMYIHVSKLECIIIDSGYYTLYMYLYCLTCHSRRIAKSVI